MSSSEPSTSKRQSNTDLRSCDWYWGAASRDEVNSWMHETEEGTFMVRQSASSDDYTLTVRADGFNRMFKVKRLENGGVELGDECYPSLIALIEHYKHNDLVVSERKLRVRLRRALPRPDKYGNDNCGTRIDAARETLTLMVRAHASYLRLCRLYDCTYELILELQSSTEHRRAVLDTYTATAEWFAHSAQLLEGKAEAQQEFEKIKQRQQALEIAKRESQQDVQQHVEMVHGLERIATAMQPRLVKLMHKRERQAFLAQRLDIKNDDLAMLLEDVNAHEASHNEKRTQRLQLRNIESEEARVKLAYQMWADCDTQAALSDRGWRIVQEKIEGILAETFVVNETTPPPPPPRTASTSGTQNAGVSVARLHAIVWPIDSYYLPQCTTTNANELLKHCAQGTFLLRNSSSKPGWLALSIVCNNTIMHCLIERDDAGYYCFNMAPSSDPNVPTFRPPTFRSIEDFVNFYRYHSLSEHNPRLDTMLLYPVHMTVSNTRQ